jgi:hypothetical protein
MFVVQRRATGDGLSGNIGRPILWEFGWRVEVVI